MCGLLGLGKYVHLFWLTFLWPLEISSTTSPDIDVYRHLSLLFLYLEVIEKKIYGRRQELANLMNYPFVLLQVNFT